VKIWGIAFVLVRILALYVLIKGLGYLINLVQLLYPLFIDFMNGTLHYWVILLLSSLTGILFIILGFILWNRTERIVVKLVDNVELNAEGPTTSNFKDLYVLGFTLVGMVLFAETLPDAITAVVQLFQNSVLSTDNQIRNVTALIGQCLKLILSIALIFRASGIYGVLMKLRELGARK